MLDAFPQEIVVPLLVSLVLGVLVFALVFPYFSGDREKDKRLITVAQGKTRKASALTSENQSSRKKSVADTIKDMEQRQKAKEKLTMRLRIQRAGLTIKPREFYIYSAAVGVIGVGLSFFFFNLPPVACIPIGFVCGAGLPRFYLKKLTQSRQKKFLRELANAIDIVVRGIKSGLPLNECLQVIARESPEPLASEFKEVVDQQKLGVTLGECLERMGDRIPLPEVRFLTIVISIQQQAGGNLSEALGNLSGVLRDRFMLTMKVKALSAEAKASAMVLGSLPPGVMTMVYLTSPDYITPLFTTTMGNFMLAGSAMWMGTGIMMMRKMINFKF